MRMSFFAFSRSAVAACRFSLLKAMALGMRKPVNSGTLVPNENEVLLVFVLV